VIEGVGYGAAFHGWRLEYQEALPPGWALDKARERGSNFHIVCLLFIRGLGLGNFGRLSDALADLREGMRLSEIMSAIGCHGYQHSGVVARRDVRYRGGAAPES
jgi:hypothetical protein